MSKIVFFGCLFVLLSGCTNDSKRSAADQASEGPTSAPLSKEAAAEEAVASLAGLWQSTTDAGYQVEFTGRTIRYLNGGELTLENKIKRDPDCSSTACGSDVGDAKLCFVESGEYDAQCLVILTCDAQRLEYVVPGSTGKTHAFTRVLKRKGKG